jgi:sugar phosphate isomerase/epimerase
VRYSYNTWNHSTTWGLDPSLDRQIAAAGAAGCDFVGLDVPSLLVSDIGAVRAWMEAAGVRCYELVPLRVPADDPAEVARVAVSVGAEAVLAVGHGTVAELVGPTREAARTLADHGVQLCFEFMPNLVIDSIGAVEALIDATGDPAPRIVVDAWHFFAGPSTWAELEALAPERLGFVQLDDALAPLSDDQVYEYRNRRGIPGEGLLDLRRFAEVVTAVRPDVVVSIEVLSEEWRRRTPAELVAASVAASRALFEGRRG